MIKKWLFLSCILLGLVEKINGYEIRSQGHHISYAYFNNYLYAQAYRFSVSFDIAISSNDYLEVYFPFSLRIADTTFPRLRIVDYGDTSKYSSGGLDYYDLDQNQFQQLKNDGTQNRYFFKIPRDLNNGVLYVIEVIPEPYTSIALPSNTYNLDAVGMKVVSSNVQDQYTIYASSTNVSSLIFQTLVFNQDTNIYQQSPVLFGVQITSNLSGYEDIVAQNGGFLVIELMHTNDNVKITFQSCGITNCQISKDNRVIGIPFSGTNVQNLGDITLSQTARIKSQISFYSYIVSKAPTFYTTTSPNAFIFDRILSQKFNSFLNSFNLILKNVFYHWKLPKDSNNEIALFVSSSTKHVYNKMTIQFSTDTSFTITDPTKEYYQLSFNLGTDYMILEGSYFTNFVSVSSTILVNCRFASQQIICSNIQELLVNVIYEINFKVIILNSTNFKIQSIQLSFFSGSSGDVISQVAPATISALTYNFVSNVDTTQYGSNTSWSPYLNDLQVISVEDVGTNDSNTIVQRSFYTTTNNKGGGIVISRSVESLVFFLSISPNMICSGSCAGNNKIIKMTMIANNNFLKFSSTDTSGLKLAAQNLIGSNYSFNGLDCSKVLVGCSDGQTSQVLDGSYVKNGKQVDTTYQIAKYTLRCGIVGAPVQPQDSCSKMFQGMESNLNTYADGMGGVFYIKQVDISNSFVQSRVVADDQQPDFMIVFSLEDPMNMSAPSTITLRTMINAYVISYHSADNVGFKANFVNFSKDSQGLYSPSLLRLRVSNSMDNKTLIIFLDNSIELTSFIDPNESQYSCQVIVQSDTLLNFDQTECLAFRGSEQLSSANYIFHNVVVVDITNMTGRSYYEVLLPIAPSQTNTADPTFLYVGYGVLVDVFKKGLPSLAIQELISVYGITSKGPTLQTTISPYFLTSSLLNEDLTGQQKIYSYPGPSQSIQFSLAITQSNTKITLTDSSNLLNYANIINDASSCGAGIILTSIFQDPFQDQVELSAKSGTFPNQSGKCYKFSYYMSRQTIDLTVPLDRFKNQIRYSVFCPFDDTTTAPAVSPLKIFKSLITTSTLINQFFLSQSLQDNSVFALAVSEKRGRNIAQQNVAFNMVTNIITATAAITSPTASFNVNILYAYNLNFRIDQFNYLPVFANTLVIEITIDNNYLQGNLNFNSIKVILNDLIQLNSIFSLTASILKITLNSDSTTIGMKIQSLTIQTNVIKTSAGATLGSNTIIFLFNLYFMLDYYPRAVVEKLYFNTAKYSASIVFSYGTASPFKVDIEKPVFQNNVEGSRDVLQFSFQISNGDTGKTGYDPSESMEIIPGFLRNPTYSYDNCILFANNQYSLIDHNLSTFANYVFKFKTSIPYTTIFYFKCYGVQVYDSTNVASYSLKYYNSLNVDMISLVNRKNELINAQWSRQLPALGLTISSIFFENQDGGINSFDIDITQDTTKVKQSFQGEFIVYFPREIDLNEHIYNTNLESTTTYIAELHALRIKVQSQMLDNPAYQFHIFPIYLTQQLITAAPNRYIYLEILDVVDKKVIDFSYRQMNIDFSLCVEKQLYPIQVTSASLQSGIQKSIDQLTVSLKVQQQSYGIQNLRIIYYTRIGSQLYLRPYSSMTANGSGNGYFITQYNQNIVSNVPFTVTLDDIFTCNKSQIKDLLFIPIYIYIYQNGSLVAMTFLQMKSLVGLNLLTDSSVYTQRLFSYFADSDGDFISVIPLYFNLVDINQKISYKEMNDYTFNHNVPLIYIQNVDDIRSSKDIYLFTQNILQSNQLISNLYLLKDQTLTYQLSYQLEQINQYSHPQVFIKNTYNACQIYSEFAQYFVQQSETVYIRIFFDDHCKILDATINPQIIGIIPAIPISLGQIVDTTPLTLSSRRVCMFQINISSTATLNIAQFITYSLTGMSNIQIAQTEVRVRLASNGLLDLSKISISPSGNSASINTDCQANKLIYFELNLIQRKDSFLSNTDLIAYAVNGQIKQADFETKTSGQISSHQIGSFQCNPVIQGSINTLFTLNNLIDNTNYQIKFYSPDSQSALTKEFQTSGQNYALLYMEIMILEDISLLSDPNANLIRSQFICLLSYYLKVPHYIIRQSGFPQANCQSYLDTSPLQFSSSITQTKQMSEICDELVNDSLWQNDMKPLESQQYQKFSKEFSNDTNIFFEIDYSLAETYRLDYQIKIQNAQFQSLNNFQTGNSIRVCQNSFYFTAIINHGNIITPQVKLKTNSCSKSLRCTLSFEQISGSSILYVALSKTQLSLDSQKQINVNSFRQNTFSFLKRYVYPLDAAQKVDFKFLILKPDTKYYAYYFLTDLTLQDYVYQYPDIQEEIVEFITTYEASLLLLYIVIPIAAAVVLAGIYYGIKYLRNRNKIQPQRIIQEAESNDEDFQQIQDIENNRFDRILDDLVTEKVGNTPMSDKERNIKCQQIVQIDGKVDFKTNQKKVISSKVIQQHYKGKIDDIEEVILL